jgi:hypothetical protein
MKSNSFAHCSKPFFQIKTYEYLLSYIIHSWQITSLMTLAHPWASYLPAWVSHRPWNAWSNNHASSICFVKLNALNNSSRGLRCSYLVFLDWEQSWLHESSLLVNICKIDIKHKVIFLLITVNHSLKSRHLHTSYHILYIIDGSLLSWLSHIPGPHICMIGPSASLEILDQSNHVLSISCVKLNASIDSGRGMRCSPLVILDCEQSWWHEQSSLVYIYLINIKHKIIFLFITRN